MSVLYPHPYVQVLQKGHPDSGLYNLVPYPLTHTHELKTLSASSVVPYLTTDNKRFRVPAPWKQMQGQTFILTLRKMSAISHTTANFIHKRYISAKIRSIFLQIHPYSPQNSASLSPAIFEKRKKPCSKNKVWILEW